MLRVRAVGVGSSVRDAGRLGLAHVGRGRGGAVDLESLHLANRLVGNRPDAATVETSGGLALEIVEPVLVAVAGSQADLYVDGGPALGWGVPTALAPGATLRIGRLHSGARTYLAVRGGLDDAGWPSELGVGHDLVGPPSRAAGVPRGFDGPVRLWPGPRLDWFVAGTWELLTTATWTVAQESDRTGTRLVGPRLSRAELAELPSEGVIEGAIQVPPDGQPIVMLADHPVTGGYPVVAVVDPADIGRVAQRPPGAAITFRRTR